MTELRLAKPRGFCAGVVMAIEAVRDAARDETNLGAYHDIVHNRTVVRRLEEEGVTFVERLDDLPATTRTVVFSAHGIAPGVRERAAELGLATIDATCPLVTKVHSEAIRYASLGYHILLVGDSSRHQEVLGTLGEAPEVTTLVRVITQKPGDPGLTDPETVTVPDCEKVVALTQTTLSVDDTDRTIEVLRSRFPKLVTPSRDDLCFATKNRQAAVKALAGQVDLFLVVTSAHSSNGMRLLELARSLAPRAERVESAQDLRPEWFSGANKVGLSSAASTPDDLVQDIVATLRSGNPNLTLTEEGEDENVTFRRPDRRPAARLAARG